jgi:hypothetical protein
MSGAVTSDDSVRQAAALLERMLVDPRTAPDAERLVSQLNPQAQFPNRQQREAVLAPVMTELEKERARVAALEAKWQAREEAEAAREAKRHEDELVSRMEAVKRQRGLSDEAMDRVMSRMREKNNPDVEAAAAWVVESAPKPPPATGYDYMPDTLDPYGTHSGDEKWAALRKDPKDWQTNEVKSILRDPEFLRLGNV